MTNLNFKPKRREKTTLHQQYPNSQPTPTSNPSTAYTRHDANYTPPHKNGGLPLSILQSSPPWRGL